MNFCLSKTASGTREKAVEFTVLRSQIIFFFRMYSYLRYCCIYFKYLIIQGIQIYMYQYSMINWLEIMAVGQQKQLVWKLTHNWPWFRHWFHDTFVVCYLRFFNNCMAKSTFWWHLPTFVCRHRHLYGRIDICMALHRLLYGAVGICMALTTFVWHGFFKHQYLANH